MAQPIDAASAPSAAVGGTPPIPTSANNAADHTPDTSPTTPPFSPRWIDYSAYPHIIGTVIEQAQGDIPTLLALRATCKQVKRKADRQLAINVVYDDGDFRCAHTNISLGDHPGLFRYVDQLDIYGGGCRCREMGGEPCSCLARIMNGIVGAIQTEEDGVQTWSQHIPHVQVFTSTIGRTQDWGRGGITASTTTYILDVLPSGPCAILLPHVPLPGSTTVSIVIRYDPSNLHVAAADFAPLDSDDQQHREALYEITLQPSTRVLPSDWLIYHDPGTNRHGHLLSNLFAMFAEVPSEGNQTHLLLKGFEPFLKSYYISTCKVAEGDPINDAHMGWWATMHFAFIYATVRGKPASSEAWYKLAKEGCKRVWFVTPNDLVHGFNRDKTQRSGRPATSIAP